MIHKSVKPLFRYVTCQEFNEFEYGDLIGDATIVAVETVEQIVSRQLTRPFLGWALILQAITPCAKKRSGHARLTLLEMICCGSKMICWGSKVLPVFRRKWSKNR